MKEEKREIKAKVTIDEVCARFGCTRDRLVAQYQSNIEGLKKDLEKAKAAKNGKCRGFTVENIEETISGLEAVLRT